MKIIDGKKIANGILNKLKKQIKRRGKTPGLAVILVSDDPASRLYVRIKERKAGEIGIKFEKYIFNADEAAHKTIIGLIKKLNKRKDIHGIIVQLPLPKHLDTNKIIAAIEPGKDVDGFHPKSRYISPVAQVVAELIDFTKKRLKNKKAVLFVKTELFARPIKKLLEKRGVGVQIVFFPTPSILPLLKGGGGKVGEADIIVIALGKPRILKSEMIKDGAIVIDIGVTPASPPCSPTRRGIGGVRGGLIPKFVGDFDPTGSENKKGFYTPVPGGVGPVTVAMVLANVVISAFGAQ